MSNVIDMRTERERRKLERQFNPTPLRDTFEVAVALVAVLGALYIGIGFWLLGPSEFKAIIAEWM